MRNQFAFAGVPSPVRKQLLKNFLAGHPLPTGVDVSVVAWQGWQYAEREMHYCTMESLWVWRRRLRPGDEDWLAGLITRSSWWDTVDYLAATIAGDFFRRYTALQREIPDQWLATDNMWLQRAAILYQLKYRELTDEARLFDYCRQLAEHPDFFIRKAIGWALRQYARTSPHAVQNFVDQTPLSPLSRREALKHL
jgi:3-methyladenine DNA glycosylase AlkD